MTPPKFDAPEAERKFLESGHRSTIPMQGRRIAAWSWDNAAPNRGAGPTVLLIHGWGGRGGQLHSLVEPLIAQGYSVLLFDAPAHGESSGKHATLIDFRDAILTAARYCGGIHAAIAHSMGSPSLALALQAGLELERAVFIGPPSTPLDYSVEFASKIGMTEDMRRKMQARFEKRFGIPWSALSLPDVAREMTKPLLVLHDRDDRDVPWSSGAAIAANWPGAQLVLTEGLGHRKILRDPLVARRIIEWLRSGAY